MPRLVVVVGPIASGKSTLAGALGTGLRAEGWPVAVLDLDDAVEATGDWGSLTPDRFRKAQVAFGHYVGAWLAQGVDVIAHGPLFEPFALTAVLDSAPRSAQVFYVRLVVALDVALKRVTADPDRRISKDPEFLRAAYERIGPLLDALPQGHWTFDTTTRPIIEIAEELTAALRSAPSP